VVDFLVLKLQLINQMIESSIFNSRDDDDDDDDDNDDDDINI